MTWWTGQMRASPCPVKLATRVSTTPCWPRAVTVGIRVSDVMGSVHTLLTGVMTSYIDIVQTPEWIWMIQCFAQMTTFGVTSAVTWHFVENFIPEWDVRVAQLNTADIPKAHLMKIITPQHAETSQTEHTRRGSPALTLPVILTTRDKTAQLVQVITFFVPNPINAFTEI